MSIFIIDLRNEFLKASLRQIVNIANYLAYFSIISRIHVQHQVTVAQYFHEREPSLVEQIRLILLSLRAQYLEPRRNSG